MIDLDRVSAVLVTRNADVDLEPIKDEIASAGITDVVVWNNEERGDLAVFGRYRAIRHALGDVIYVQDDDAIVAADSIRAIIAAWEPGRCVANMPERFRPHYPDSYLVGFGAAFERGLPMKAWLRYAARYYDFGGEPGARPPARPLTGAWLARFEDTFARTCDVVFTALTPGILVDVPYVERDFATGPDRMYRQPEHVGERAATLERARASRAEVAT